MIMGLLRIETEDVTIDLRKIFPYLGTVKRM